MPKSPILYREAFYAQIRGVSPDYLGNPPMRELEWNAVETELGTMVESRSCVTFAGDISQIKQIDGQDNSISRFSRVIEDAFQNQYGTGGGHCIDYNV